MDRLDRKLLFARLIFIAAVNGIVAIIPQFVQPRLAEFALASALAVLVILLENRLRRATIRSIASAIFGLFAGALFALLLILLLTQTLPAASPVSFLIRSVLPVVLLYLGLLIGLNKAQHLNLKLFGLSEDVPTQSHSKILDTSVLIDGRIADILESGFLEGNLVVPQFVLHELQFVADSPDSTKRNRGRRGLDVVQRLQSSPGLRVEISLTDFPKVAEVDLKLIELAKQMRGKLVTNDFNLNKLAQVQGIAVLNINELANSLRPVVLPGESMRVFILKEGKEHNQGVAYLDDGTMVVVDNARRQLSKNIDVLVTSVLQTTAGKMIFGKYDERPHGA